MGLRTGEQKVKELTRGQHSLPNEIGSKTELRDDQNGKHSAKQPVLLGNGVYPGVQLISTQAHFYSVGTDEP